MKSIIVCLSILILFASAQPIGRSEKILIPEHASSNLIIVTIDGFRWQELFSGADEALINDPSYTPDTSTTRMLYWSETAKERRQQLMPFFWSVLAKKGQLYGNRDLHSKMNTANIYAVSYPGYNEIFTGETDILVASNRKRLNANNNVLEYLNGLDGFHDKVVAFTSWDLFPYILNEKRSGMLINSGYENVSDTSSSSFALIDTLQSRVIADKTGMRHDQLTYIAAREYLQRYKPRVMFLGFGESDDYAHAGRYDLYLQHANQVDRMIGELWQWIQTTPGYRNNTSILITTDHGRGNDSHWKSHSSFIKGSSQTWMALMGPGIEPIGEIRERGQIYQEELAGVIAALVGERFNTAAR